MSKLDKQLCIVLRAVNYRDNDRILTLFSQENGKIVASARGARTMKSSLKAATQPFCCAEYEFYRKKDRFSITNALIKDEFYRVQNDYDKFTAGCVMLELCEKMLEQHTPEQNRLFTVLVNTLHAMETDKAGPNEALVYFFVQAADLLGVFPALDFCAVCGRPLEGITHWSAREGGAVCPACVPSVGAKKATAGIKYIAVLRGIRPSDVRAACGEGKIDGTLAMLMQEYLREAGEVRLKTMRFYTGND